VIFIRSRSLRRAEDVTLLRKVNAEIPEGKRPFGDIGVDDRNTRAVCKVSGLTLLLRVGTLWRCGDGLFFEVHPLASAALLTTLHPLLENVLQTVDHFEMSCLRAPFLRLEKPRNRMGRDLN
jgi:hypothetical protein